MLAMSPRLYLKVIERLWQIDGGEREGAGRPGQVCKGKWANEIMPRQVGKGRWILDKGRWSRAGGR